MRTLSESYSLRNALIAVVLIPLLLVFGAGSFMVSTALEHDLEARLQDDIALIARTLKVPLARSLEREREQSLDRALRSASSFGRVYGVYVYDAEGKLLARDDRLADVRMPALNDLGLQQDEVMAEYRSIGGREVYSYFTPLTNAGGQAIGMLQVTRRASEIRDYVSALRIKAVLVMLGFSAVFVTIVILGHHVAIGRPLGDLAGAMGRIAGGDRKARASTLGPREVGWLAGRFNKMLDGIAERDRVLSRERARQLKLENKLRQSEKYALVGRLASGVAHELGAPLSVVDGHAQRLMRRSSSAEEREILGRIRASSDRMAVIVRHLLGFARESAAPPRPVTVRRLVLHSVADVRSRAEESCVELEIAAGPPGTRVLADGGRLREALVHLLRNGVYAACGGRVRIGWEGACNGVRIFVENSGAPVSAGDHERIFEPFFTTKRPGDGSGLGLAIVKGTVVDHGGEISVYESALGGAGFRIDLPAGEEGADG